MSSSLSLYSYVVIGGAGRQGQAICYGLARACQARHIVVADQDVRAAEAAVARLRLLLPDALCEFTAVSCDAHGDNMKATLAGADVLVSAVPYHFNSALAEVAVACGVSFCDLGGNTDVVRQELDLDSRAREAGVSVVPDCGLAPGLGNILAAVGMARMDAPQHVHVRCGGLPQEPVGPLGYKIVFSWEGLINEYTGTAEFLRNGEKVLVPAMMELETIVDLPEPVIHGECAVTTGGTSTCADSFHGRLQTYDYKTIRYVGHWSIVKAMHDLGLFDEEVTLVNGKKVNPRAIVGPVLEAKMLFEDVKDLVVMRVTVQGTHKGTAQALIFDLLDKYDTNTSFSAMERTTAFPTAIVAFLQACKAIPPGATPLEQCIPHAKYMEELPRHGIKVVERVTSQ